jgi:RNA polymerase sigma factor (TIGR02999 family)
MDTSLTTLLAAADRGDAPAARAAFAALYDELHRLAKRELARRGPHLTLGATTLLHEAYLDLADRHGPTFPDRARFMSYAAKVMRGVLIDYVRRRRARKRGGGFEITAIDGDVADPGAGAATDLETLSEALEALAAVDARLAEVVDLKFFCGFTFVEIAAMRQVSLKTVQRDWEKARLFLHQTLGDASLPD